VLVEQDYARTQVVEYVGSASAEYVAIIGAGTGSDFAGRLV